MWSKSKIAEVSRWVVSVQHPPLQQYNNDRMQKALRQALLIFGASQGVLDAVDDYVDESSYAPGDLADMVEDLLSGDNKVQEAPAVVVSPSAERKMLSMLTHEYPMSERWSRDAMKKLASQYVHGLVVLQDGDTLSAALGKHVTKSSYTAKDVREVCQRVYAEVTQAKPIVVPLAAALSLSELDEARKRELEEQAKRNRLEIASKLGYNYSDSDSEIESGSESDSFSGVTRTVQSSEERQRALEEEGYTFIELFEEAKAGASPNEAMIALLARDASWYDAESIEVEESTDKAARAAFVALHCAERWESWSGQKFPAREPTYAWLQSCIKLVEGSLTEQKDAHRNWLVAGVTSFWRTYRAAFVSDEVLEELKTRGKDSAWLQRQVEMGTAAKAEGAAALGDAAAFIALYRQQRFNSWLNKNDGAEAISTPAKYKNTVGRSKTR